MTDRSTDVLIVGSGFAGLCCFQAVNRKKRKVTLLTSRNHFLFTPLLPLAAVGTVEVRSIVEPIFSFQKSEGEIIIGEASDIQPEEKILLYRCEDRIEQIVYKELVIAVGAVTASYGTPGVEEHCHYVKEMRDARALREKILYQFERAASLTEERRAKALHFVIVGAGATGVEVACEIHDLVQHDMKRHYRQLAASSKIEIVEASKEILLAFDRTLASYAQNKIRQKGILLRTEAPVKAVEKDKVHLKSGEVLEAETIIWATGNAPGAFTQKVAESLKINLDRGRIPVSNNLEVISPFEGIYAAGDCAVLKDSKGQPFPATAQVAMKQGLYLGKSFSGKQMRPFHFQSMGMLASLGSGSALADLGFMQFKGVLAWWFWKAAYLTKLVSLRNKISVLMDWSKVKFFGRNTARIDF